jgi:alpha-L-fucosidase
MMMIKNRFLIFGKKYLVIPFFFLFMVLDINAQKVAPPAPYGVIPTSQQIEWQKMEYYMFIHFGPNAFTDKEWGDGKEHPNVFNPTNLDARQWARTAKEAGMKAIIITAKHHDGFCLWPSKFSTHTVRESPWRDGKGDVLKELSEACKEYGLKFGVYLSPWDQNHPDYGTPQYNQVFANTLKEVLTNYGEVFEQWFDGANGEGPNGKSQEYDWPLFHKVVYQSQPNAVIFSDIGPGARWIGNENGIMGETNWSTLNTKGFGMGKLAPSQKVLNTGNENGQHWIPAEADVSIRPGWFFSPKTNDKVKTLSQLLNIYYSSVGRNANLLLNVPVDRRGLIHPNDSTRLIELRKVIDATFKTNLAKGKKTVVSNTRGGAKEYGAQNLTDGNYNTYWTVDDDIKNATLTLEMGKQTEVNRLVLQEYIPLGQRIRSFSVEYWNGKKYVELDKQTTVGYKRILTFPTIKTNKIKITIEANAAPILSEIQLYKALEIMEAPLISRSKDGIVSIKSISPDPIITYTVDGTEPTFASKRYKGSFDFKNGGVVKSNAFINKGKNFSDVVMQEYDMATDKWKILNASESEKGFSVQNAFDGNLKTSWISRKDEKAQTREIAVDMGEALNMSGFTYTPSLIENQGGNVYKYNFYISEDGLNWNKIVKDGTFGNIKNNPVKQTVKFNKKYTARFIKLEALSQADEKASWISVAEIGIKTE